MNGARIPTGSDERNKANNIYDLAGNIHEWTLESNGEGYRYMRGGCSDNSGIGVPASYRFVRKGYSVSWGSSYGYGFRVCFYIK